MQNLQGVFYMKANIKGDFQIFISVPLRILYLFMKTSVNPFLYLFKKKNVLQLLVFSIFFSMTFPVYWEIRSEKIF